MASGNATHAEGEGSVASGNRSHAEGHSTTASGEASHAEGLSSIASGTNSHAEGNTTTANGDNSHTEGLNTQTTISGVNAHAEGEGNTASGRASHVEGGGLDPLGNPAPNLASGDSSHAEGIGTTASGFAAHAEGGTQDITSLSGPQAFGDFSHAEGMNTIATGNFGAHAEGQRTIASGSASHAEGFQTTAVGPSAHAEGANTIASGAFSHAEGIGTTANGIYSHSEGADTTASGQASHAEGLGTIANADFSHTEGLNTTASGLNGVHVMGQNGGPAVGDLPFSWYLVNGALGGVVAKILNDGSACFEGDVSANIVAPVACDFAEMFETSNGKPIDVGYFVTFDGETEKIRIANSFDDFIVGITSSNPAVLADIQDPECSKYLLDEWNRPVYEEVIIPDVTDNEGNILIGEHKLSRKKLNPLWDPSNQCGSRLEKPEWVAVGLVGKLLVRDDGTCKAGGYCRPFKEGIATAADQGFRVMKRTGQNQVLILLNSIPSIKEIDIVEKLEKLAKLKEQGFLTDEEFQIQKQKLLSL
jgi:autotransporter adhesin